MTTRATPPPRRPRKTDRLPLDRMIEPRPLGRGFFIPAFAAARFSRLTGRRLVHVDPRCHARLAAAGHPEGAGRALADPPRHLGHGRAAPAQQFLRQCHAPALQVVHRRHPERPTERLEEGRAGHARPPRQLRHRPGLCRIRVQRPQCRSQAWIQLGHAADPAAPLPRPAAQRLVQQHLRQPPQHQGARGPLGQGLLVDHPNQRGQPLLAADLDNLRQQ